MASTHNTLLELMERTGITSESLALGYLKEAFRELEAMKISNISTVKYNIVSGQRAYALPSDYSAVLGVYRLTENSKYRLIPRLTDLTLYTE